VVTFDFSVARSLDDVLNLRSQLGERAAPVAGGTNLIVDLRAEKRWPELVVDISGLREISSIDELDGGLRLGANVTLAQAMADPRVVSRYPVLVDCCRDFANPLIRNRATFGGNLVDASPAADTPPPLLALGASVRLVSTQGERHVPLDKFFLGYRSTELQPSEILAYIDLPPQPKGTRGAWYKLGLRKADAIAIVSVAVVMTLEEDRCTSARIALGAVAPIPMRAYRAEGVLLGERVTDALVEKVGDTVMEEVKPIDDILGTAEYRRWMSKVLVQRCIRKILVSS
jgi:CO/xanthine dehydrogenase FAD-binding subunit